VLTRAIREDGLHELVMGLVHWGLFEMPGLNLDEIEIPIKTIPGGTLPDAKQIEALKAPLLKCIEKLGKEHPELKFKQISDELRAFQPDPEDLDQFLLMKSMLR